LEFLGLARNNISGAIPDLMAQLTSLNIHDLAQNNITGPLPSFVGNFTSLSYVDLSYNHLTGHVPYEIGMLANVSYLNINHNDLDGTITEEHFAGLKSLQWIDLSANSLKIQISSEWKPPFTLMESHFGSCRMGPLFPSWLKWMVDIYRLDISNTSINDHLPDWFCSTFSKVTYLSIANNQIRGGLPASMESMSLIQLFLGSNQLMGKIPPMPMSLTTLDLSNNYFSGPLP
jgi:Leucine-rich repeat (LRR) protein